MPVLKKITLFPALLLFAAAAFAQDPMYNDTAAVPKPSVKTIRLSTSERTLSAVTTRPISGVEVVQYLWDSTHIGYAQKGMMNSVVIAAPDTNATAYLQSHINSAYGHLYKQGGVQILMIVEALRIAERTGGMSEKAYLRFKGTTYGTTNGNSFVELATADIVKNNGGMDVTHKHKTNIANAIQDLMDSTIAHLDNALAHNTAALSKEGIMNIYEAKRNIPALKDSLVDGVYRSFEEFKTNKPSSREFDISQQKRKILIVDKAGKPIDCWGVVKDGEVLRNLGYTVLPISKYQNGFIITKYLENARKRNSAILWSSVAGGAIAGAIVGKTVQLVNADAFPDLTPLPNGTAIDMETGAFIF
ncbi:hypothetical protein SAMN05444266_105463 [Chitinophaga jiangningensis]|uniref:Uncharacterized protein n=1 Tax=Chitinophaga jiangningensis TaxID=1419482 RepID=A0A1M7EJX4_9BACT|nr:hypothetical protein [Chitinophaga jiangningensis]SHL91649.1 hypothetical protein SAMN05444266_105463 [Chitinophaga jiangningensis]